MFLIEESAENAHFFTSFGAKLRLFFISDTIIIDYYVKYCGKLLLYQSCKLSTVSYTEIIAPLRRNKNYFTMPTDLFLTINSYFCTTDVEHTEQCETQDKETIHYGRKNR